MRGLAAKETCARFETALDTHEQAFEKSFFAPFLGLDFADLPEDAGNDDKDCCRIEFDVTEFVMNPQGALHGRIMASVMDISMGHLVNRLTGPAVAIEMKIQFTRPVGAGRAVCEGRFLRRGRNLSVMEGRLWSPDGKLAGTATAIWKMP